MLQITISGSKYNCNIFFCVEIDKKKHLKKIYIYTIHTIVSTC